MKNMKESKEDPFLRFSPVNNLTVSYLVKQNRGSGLPEVITGNAAILN
jgi:hypothetical protein